MVFLWILCFAAHAGLLAAALYSLVLIADLQSDFINPHDCTSGLNKWLVRAVIEEEESIGAIFFFPSVIVQPRSHSSLFLPPLLLPPPPKTPTTATTTPTSSPNTLPSQLQQPSSSSPGPGSRPWPTAPSPSSSGEATALATRPSTLPRCSSRPRRRRGGGRGGSRRTWCRSCTSSTGWSRPRCRAC